MSENLTTEQMGLLSLAATYGDGFDLTGSRISAQVRQIARSLIASGHLSCATKRLKNIWVTEKGQAALDGRTQSTTEPPQ